MRKRCLRLTLLIALPLLFQLTPPLSHGQYRCPPGQPAHGWPIEPMNQEHPIGNSFGEFQDHGQCINSVHCVYQHAGIDILGTPKYDSVGPNAVLNPSAPWVSVTVGGTVDYVGGSEGCDSQDQSDNNSGYYVSINGDDGQIHQYGHLQHCSFDKGFLSISENGGTVAAGSRIAQLVRWTSCDFHHLHYEIIKGNNYMSPLACITPHQDGESPQINSISFAVNNSGSNSNDWVPLNTVDPQGCTLVYGEVDIVAQIRDRDSACSNHVGTKTLWVHNVRWRACPESNPDCPWNNTYLFDSMPATWFSQGNNSSTSAYFSVSEPWVSEEDYCVETPLYAVVTNFVGGTPDRAGFWDTGKIPDGKYIVSVEATDFAGKTAVSSVNVCVRNSVPPDAPRDLRIR